MNSEKNTAKMTDEEMIARNNETRGERLKRKCGELNTVKDNATPRPWGFNKGAADIFSEVNNKIACTVYDSMLFPKCGNDREAQANAKLIVRAVNSHEALCDVIKDAIACIDNHIAKNPNAKSELPELREHLNKAIQLAEKQ